MGKGEIARYEQFFLFPQCFQKACFQGASKGVIVWDWVNRGFWRKMFSNTLWVREKMLVKSIFSFSHRNYFIIWSRFKVLFTNALILDQSIFLSCGKEFREIHNLTLFQTTTFDIQNCPNSKHCKDDNLNVTQMELFICGTLAAREKIRVTNMSSFSQHISKNLSRSVSLNGGLVNV